MGVAATDEIAKQAKGESMKNRITLAAFMAWIGVCLTASHALAGPAGTIDKTFGQDGLMVSEGNLDGVVDAEWMGNNLVLAINSGLDGWGCVGTKEQCSNPPDRHHCFLQFLNQNGQIDTSFGQGGLIFRDVSGLPNRCHELSLHSGGFLVSESWDPEGYKWGSLDKRFALTKFKKDGGLDIQFGTQGSFFIEKNYGAQSFVVLPDMSIVVALSPGYITGVAPRKLIKLMPNGALDSGFGSNGQIDLMGLLGEDVSLSGVDALIVSQGRILVAGDAVKQAVRRPFVVALTESGQVDSSFKASFFNKAPLLPGQDDDDVYYFKEISLQDDKILIGGFWYCGINEEQKDCPYVMRLNQDGSVDETFAKNGLLDFSLEAIGSTNNIVLEVQPDQKIAVATQSYESSLCGQEGGCQVIFRYMPDGLLDKTFASSGMLEMAPTVWTVG